MRKMMSKDKSAKRKGGKANEPVGIKAMIVNACCIFTVLIFALYLLTTLILGNVTFTTNLGNTAAIFALSFALSAATLAFERKKLPFWESTLILFFLIGAIYYLIVVRLTGMHTDLRGTLTAMGIYVFAFLIYVAIKLIVRKKKNKKTEKEKEYQSKF